MLFSICPDCAICLANFFISLIDRVGSGWRARCFVFGWLLLGTAGGKGKGIVYGSSNSSGSSPSPSSPLSARIGLGWLVARTGSMGSMGSMGSSGDGVGIVGMVFGIC